jgi:spore coat protein U-like protein
MFNKSNVIKNAFRLVIASAIAASAPFLGPMEASAATNTADLDVSAEVSANCTISTIALAFGSYDPVVAHASAALDGQGTVTVTCTNGSTTVITLGQGLNADAASTDASPVRQMVSGANQLSYALYSDSSRTTPWGNTSETGVSHVGSGASTNLTVYGSVSGGQNVPAGSYSDTVVATVTF